MTVDRREAWVRAALALVAREGVGAVSVERLARQLGVTKGSFYWHFADRAALLRAVLDRWRRVSTGWVIEQVEAGGGGPAQRLHALLALASSHPSAAGLEQAVRAWGAVDAGARRVLRAVDARRAAYVVGLLVEAGVPQPQAARRAEGLYLALVGEYAVVARGGRRTGAEVWVEWVELALSLPGRGGRGR